MTILKYKIAPRATKDLCDLKLFLEAAGEGDVFFLIKKRIKTAIAMLREFPELGIYQKEVGARAFSVPKTRYIIFFQKTEDLLEILRIFHTSQKW